MKRVWVIIQYALLNAIPYAIGYGLGEFIGELFGFPKWLTYTFAYVLLLIAGAIGAKFLRWYESRHHVLGGRIFLASLLVYVCFDLFTDYFFEESLFYSLLDNLGYELCVGLIAFGVTRLVLVYKTWRARRIYGTGEQGVRGNFSREGVGESHVESKEFNQLIESDDYDHDLAVKCKTGIYVGSKSRGVVSFKGIPYAQPPVGTLRWKAPQPLPPSDVVCQALHFSSVCPQPWSAIPELNSLPQSEDCLTLNIWSSAKSEFVKRPVVVFLPGGDLTFGGSALSLYDGTAFVRQNPDTLFVSLNFRLGILGVMDFSRVPGGEAYADSTDLPLLDILAALRWLKENVSAFQGDPGNITLLGNDTGGLCAAILATVPQAKELFHRVVLLSSSCQSFCTPEKAQRWTADLLEYLHVSTMDELVRLPVGVLRQAQEALKWYLTDFVAGRGMVPANLLETYRNGAAAGIDLICCTTENSAGFYVVDMGAQRAREFLQRLAGELHGYVREEEYQLYEEYTQSAKDLGAALPGAYFFNFLFYHSFALALCRAHAANHYFARYFRWRVGSPIQAFGAFCNIEVPFILGTLDAVEKYGIVGDKQSGRIMQCALAKFAKDGNPELPMGTVCHNKFLHWPNISTDETPVLLVDEECLVVDAHECADQSLPVEKLLLKYPDAPIFLMEKTSELYKRMQREIADGA